VTCTAFIGIGSNIGDRQRYCTSGIEAILKDDRVGSSALSSFYVTSPVSPMAQEDFLNCVLRITWNGSAPELLDLLLRIEEGLGRVRAVPLGPRVIDLDILLIDDLVIDTPELTVPHPRLHERKFTLVPILELDPHVVHPLLHRPLREFLDKIGEEQKIEAWHGEHP
jgi:2-amino-4-hydroxy-6-hydroxymethyldihydropteridine diphosphokinase